MPYADPEQQRAKSRQKMRELRAKKKRKLEEMEAKILTQKPNRIFPLTFKEYKIHFPGAIFVDFLEDKQKYESVENYKIRDPRIEQILDRNLYPFRTEDCKRFRLQISGNVSKDPFFCAEHHTICSSCQGWFHDWKDFNKGANAW